MRQSNILVYYFLIKLIVCGVYDICGYGFTHMEIRDQLCYLLLFLSILVFEAGSLTGPSVCCLLFGLELLNIKLWDGTLTCL